MNCSCPQLPTAGPEAPERWQCPTCSQVWLMWIDNTVENGRTVFREWYERDRPGGA